MSKLEAKYILPADDDYVVADVLLANGALTIANTTLDFSRNLTMTVTDGDSGLSAGIMTVVGTDDRGDAQSEVFTLPVDGTATVTGTKMFKTITSATVSAAAGNGAGDNIKVGIGSTVQIFEQAGEFGAIIIGETAAGTITITDEDSKNSKNTLAVLKASIAEGEYRFDCSISKGLRIVFGAASKVSVTFARSTFN